MRTLFVAPIFVALAHPVLAGDNPLVGTWRLTSFVRQIGSTGERYDQLGPHPRGFITYTPDGRMSVLIVDGDVRPPVGDVPSEAERARMHATMIAYAGSYRVDDRKVVHHIEIAWNRARISEDQVRFYTLSGSRLTLTTAPNKSPVDGREGVGVLEWERVEPSSP